MKVFYSWQADRPQAVCRNFIRDAIVEALARVAAHLGFEEADRPEIDHDTKNTVGWVEITNEILNKIENCAVFVADVTPIAKTEHTSKEVPNPNVIMELGYALKAVGPQRIVLVTNTEFGARRPESLPFNMRHRSAPASYRLKKDATAEQVAAAKSELVEQLVDWLGNCLKHVLGSAPAPVERWHEPHEGDNGAWFAPGATLKHQGFFGNGITPYRLTDGPRSYVRLLPTRWKSSPVTRETLHEERGGLGLSPLGRMGNGDGGLNSDGVVSYTVIPGVKKSPLETPTLAQYFQKTGEIWGIDTMAIQLHQGRLMLPLGYLVERWSWFIGRALAIYDTFGASAPIHVRIGLNQLDGTVLTPSLRPAVDDSFEIHDTLHDMSEAEQLRVITAAYNKLLQAYGLTPVQEMEPAFGQVEKLLFHPKS